MSTLLARPRVALHAAVVCLFVSTTSHAAITTTGDVTPDPNTTTSDDDLYVGNTADGTMRVDDGSDVLSYLGYLGCHAGVTGAATVDGAGSTWNSSGPLVVGQSGRGTLTVSNGGQVTGHYLIVGDEGTGTVDIIDGGQISSCYPAIIGNADGAVGSVTVAGAGSTWTHDGFLEVGYWGTGSLAISGGGRVTCGSVVRMGGAAAQATVNVAGSTWDIDGYLRMYSGTLDVTRGAALTSRRGVIGAGVEGPAIVTIDGDGSTWNIHEVDPWGTEHGDLHVGYLDGGPAPGGELHISGGAHVTSVNTYIASGVPGFVTVSGDGSVLTSTGELRITGSYVGGTSLEIAAGGTVVCDTALVSSYDDYPMMVTIDGAGSTWEVASRLEIGMNEESTLSVSGGAAVNVGGDMEFNDGTLYIGPGSTVNVAHITDYQGDELDFHGGTFRTESFSGRMSRIRGGRVVIDGGTFTQTASSLTLDGATPDDNPTLELIGSTSDMYHGRFAPVIVGDANQATLIVSAGAKFGSDGCTIGKLAGSKGTVTVDGGSAWYVWDLQVGAGGTGTLDITGGSVVEAGDVYLGSGGGEGTINLRDGTLRLWDGGLRAYASGQFNFSGGRLEGARWIDFGSGPFVQSGGTLAPGMSPQEHQPDERIARTSIVGGYTLDGGTLEIDIDGLGIFGFPGVDWDFVEVTGPVDLVGDNGLVDGRLDIILGYAPSPGDEFLVLENDDVDPILGLFATAYAVRAPFDGDLYQFTIDYTAGDGNDIALVTQGIVGLVGDYNGDGSVDAADYTVWRDSLGATVAPYFGADGNGDGLVDDADHAVWKARYGTTAAGEAALAAVPEPAGLALLLLGTLVASVARQRSR